MNSTENKNRLATTSYKRQHLPIDKLTGGWRVNLTHLYGETLNSTEVWYVYQHRKTESGEPVNMARGYVVRMTDGSGRFQLFDTLPDSILPNTYPKMQNDYTTNHKGDPIPTGTQSIITGGSPDAAARQFGNIKMASKTVLETGHVPVATDDKPKITDAILEGNAAEESIGKNARKRLLRLMESQSTLRIVEADLFDLEDDLFDLARTAEPTAVAAD